MVALGGRVRGALLSMLVTTCVLVGVGACSRTTDEPAQPAPPQATSAPGATGAATMDCGDTALLQAPGEALAVFPDSPDVVWTARPSDEMLVDLVLVSMTPEPADVGYPELRFVYRCDAGGPSYLAAYGLEGQAFVLVTTSDSLADTEIPEQLPYLAPESS